MLRVKSTIRGLRIRMRENRGFGFQAYENTFSVANPNLLTDTENFSTSSWGSQSAITVTTDTDIAPNGTTTADKIENTTANAEHRIRKTFTYSASTQYTYSVYMKNVDARYGVLRTFNSDRKAIFDLVGGTAVYSTSGVDATSITAVGSGWYRVSITITTGGTITTNNIEIAVHESNLGTTNSYTGTVKSILVWGAKVELGGVMTDYISA